MLRKTTPFFLVFFLLNICVSIFYAQSQTTEMTPLALNDMSGFKPQDGNWQIVGNVAMDRTIDVHTKGNEGVTTQTGTGIIVNLNDKQKKSALVTTWEHGDIDIELEFMLPKGSNSGIYLQGRYEVQLYDSWGVKSPKFSDLGGIYRNWERQPDKVYMGKAPLSNPAKAPGLWQKMFIAFRAPRFDAAGKKITNARMVRVDINGVTIHDNVEIPLPTGGPIENNEKATGPLMIQGDHGPVALRNIKYRSYKDQKVTVSDISYKYWLGKYENEDEYRNKTPQKTGKAEVLTWDVSPTKDTFGLQLTGKMLIPADGTYYFSMVNNGGTALYIDGQKAATHYRAWDWDAPKPGKIDLKAGTHTFDLFYHRNDTWIQPGLGLFVEGSQIEKHPLHSFASLPQRQAVSPIFVHVGSQPKLLRAFLDFNFDRKLRRTHTVGVGDPSGLHYIFDNQLGVLSCVWRGDFVDATPMWHDRGDGSFRPLGDVVFLSNTPQLAVLSDKNAAFPASYSEADFRSKGYKIEENTARPVFRYVVKGMEVEDRTFPDDEYKNLTREIKVNTLAPNTYFKVAEGADISALPDGSFIVDKKMYVKVTSADKPSIRESNSKKELIVALTQNTVKYTLIW